MMRYLSYGGGVNSTALLLLMEDEGVEFEAVFVDHGGDYPETYQYVAMLQERGHAITVIRPKAYGEFEGLYDYCEASRMVPVRIMRWCTDHFKMRPLYEYFERPAEVLVGIDAGESRRAKDSRDKQLSNIFPLVDRGIDRAGCEAIIEAHGLPIPKKSGCWFCPFQRRSQWVDLSRRHPELWCKALTLEAINCGWALERGVEPMWLAGRPLEEVVRAKDGHGHYQPDDQGDLFDDRRPCQCGL